MIDQSNPFALIPNSPETDAASGDVVIAEYVTSNTSTFIPRRVWTSLVVVVLSMLSILVAGVVMRVFAVWWLSDQSLTVVELLSPERLKEAFRSRSGLVLMVVIPQFALTVPALFAALCSQESTRTRLGLVTGHWPIWAWCAAACVTPIIGLISTVLLGGFVEDSESLKEMSEIFRGHGKGGFMIPLALLIGATPALCEEILFRGYVQTRLTHVMRPAWGILLASILFAAFHMDPIHSLGVLPLGIFLGWVRWRSGSLLPAMLGHFLNNFSSVILMSLAPDGETLTLADLPLIAVFLSILAAGLIGTVGLTAATWYYGPPQTPHDDIPAIT